MRKSICFALALAMILAGCASPTPTSAPTVTVAPTFTPTPEPISPALESNVIPDSGAPEQNAELIFPTSLAELHFEVNEDSAEQLADYLRQALSVDMDGDGVTEEFENGYDAMWLKWITNLWNSGRLGEGIETLDQAIEKADELYRFVPAISQDGTIWTMNPVNIATGRIGVAYDPATRLPFPTLMPVGVGADEFETRFMVGEGEQSIASNNSVFTIIVKDPGTDKPRWYMNGAGKWVEAPDWLGEGESRAMLVVQKVLERFEIDAQNYTIVEGEDGLVQVIDAESEKVVMTSDGEETRYDLAFLADTVAAPSCEPTEFAASSNGSISGGNRDLLDKTAAYLKGMLESEGWPMKREDDSRVILIDREKLCWGYSFGNGEKGYTVLWRDIEKVVHSMKILTGTTLEMIDKWRLDR